MVWLAGHSEEVMEHPALKEGRSQLAQSECGDVPGVDTLGGKSPGL